MGELTAAFYLMANARQRLQIGEKGPDFEFENPLKVGFDERAAVHKIMNLIRKFEESTKNEVQIIGRKNQHQENRGVRQWTTFQSMTDPSKSYNLYIEKDIVERTLKIKLG
jgi:hypothetical protein